MRLSSKCSIHLEWSIFRYFSILSKPIKTTTTTRQDVWRRSRCPGCWQWLRNVQGWICWRWCSQSRIPFHCWQAQAPGCNGWNGSEGFLCGKCWTSHWSWLEMNVATTTRIFFYLFHHYIGRWSPVKKRYSDLEIPNWAWDYYQLGWHGENLAPHFLQWTTSCPRGTSNPVDWSPIEPKGQQRKDDSNYVWDL